MSAETITDPLTGEPIDPDEDLFAFEDASQAHWGEDEDLGTIFAAFEAEEARRAAEGAASVGEDDADGGDDALPGDEDFAGLHPEANPPGPMPARAPEKAHALSAPDEDDLARGAHLERDRPADASAQGPAYAPPPAWAPVAYAPPAYPWPPPQPAPQPTAVAGAASAGGLRVAAWMLIAITSLNALVALVALRSDHALRRSLDGMGQEFARSASDLMRGALGTVQSVEPGYRGEPLATLDPDQHPSFALATEEIQRGEYGRARRRLYSLLAIVDRLDPQVREEIEARASFLIARSLHLESLGRWEQSR